MNGFGRGKRSQKKEKSKAPHVKPTCGPPRFGSGFIVRATRPTEVWAAVGARAG